jgi:glycerol-3-phosphate O-acyltransferase/dihydroxyacetone phosphate acyltransferase
MSPAITYEAALVFWRVVTQIFFREIRPRGAFNIPHNGPVIFVGAPHSNQVNRHSKSLEKPR